MSAQHCQLYSPLMANICPLVSARFGEGEEGEHASSSWRTCQHLLLRPHRTPGHIPHVHLTGKTHTRLQKIVLACTALFEAVLKEKLLSFICASACFPFYVFCRCGAIMFWVSQEHLRGFLQIGNKRPLVLKLVELIWCSWVKVRPDAVPCL